MNRKSIYRRFLALKRKLFGGVYTAKELRLHGVQMGERCYVYGRLDLEHGFLITLGDDVTISTATILAHDGSTCRELRHSRVGRVDIGDRVFIGANAIVLPGVKIGNDVIIGAGAVVTRDVPDDSVCVGNPARVIGSTHDYMEKNRKLMNDGNTWNVHYSKKSDEEKEAMRQVLLQHRIGFDI